MALNFYEFSGQITIKLKCGCRMELDYYEEMVALPGGNTDFDQDINIIWFDRCNKHKGVSDLDVDLERVVASAIGTAGVKNGFALLSLHDAVRLQDSLDIFVEE